MSKLQKYDSYKDSGVKWLGEIPVEWKVKKLKFLGKIFAGLSDKKGDDFSKEYDITKKEFIPFTNICNNVKIDKEQVQYVNIKNNEKQNKLLKNDIIFLMSSETLDDIGKCSIFLHDGEFYLNSFCKGYRLFSEEAYPEYINYLLQSKLYRIYFSIVGRGFTRINIKQEYINDLFSLLPPKQEQIKIASFLDTKTEQLNKAIKQKEQLIELLKERRQILINDAVTKGIDKTVAMKDSGVEWIGEIPEHWEVKKLKYNLQLQNKKANIDKKLVIALENIESFTGKYIETNSQYTGEDNIFQKYDILFGKLRPYLSKVFLCQSEGIAFGDLLTYRPKSHFDSKFAFYLLLSVQFIKTVDSSTYGSKMPRASSSFINEMLICTPPKEEQIRIAEYIEENNKKTDKAISLQQKQIKKLKEYKTTLIDSVVTGKVRVCDE